MRKDESVESHTYLNHNGDDVPVRYDMDRRVGVDGEQVTHIIGSESGMLKVRASTRQQAADDFRILLNAREAEAHQKQKL